MHGTLERWQVAWAQATRTSDALLFATDVLGFLRPGAANPNGDPQLETWQVAALKKFSKQWANRFKKPPRLAIKSGHGVGKTCFLSILILFVLLTAGPDCKIPVVANSMDQLRDGLWPEINKWMQRLPEPLRVELDWQKEKVQVRAYPEEAFAVRRTASKHRPEALQGMHAKTILVVFEEASGIPEETVEAGAGTLSTPGAGIVAVGNPTRAVGFFHRIMNHPKMVAIWERMTVNSEDVPRAVGHIADIVALYGKDSNKYRVRVKGLFPTKDDDTVIPLELAESAKGRKVEAYKVWPIWGLDVARFGDDRSPLTKRMGNLLLEPPIVWRNMDGGQIAGRVVKEYLATPFDMRPKAICVDVIGYGASVVDFLRRSPELIEDDVMIVAVNVSESAANDELHHRLRDELWFSGRDWFSAKDCCIIIQHLNDEQLALINELISELTVATYDISVAGKRVVLSKELMKKDLGYSPDLADSFLLTFAAPVFARASDRHHDSGRYRGNQDNDPWAA